MDEYIKREAAMEQCNRHSDYTAWSILNGIEAIPAADVAPVVHGRWVSVPHKLARVCSACNRDEPYKFADIDAIDAYVYDYCPNCGARMDGDSDAKAD